jgi:hypothetical protein
VRAKVQIQAYNDDFDILRESGCSNYEKPFVFLFFGSERAILFDTGAGQSRTPYQDHPIRTVYQPNEHALDLGRAHLVELNDALIAMHGVVVKAAFRDFTIWPQ